MTDQRHLTENIEVKGTLLIRFNLKVPLAGGEKRFQFGSVLWRLFVVGVIGGLKFLRSFISLIPLDVLLRIRNVFVRGEFLHHLLGQLVALLHIYWFLLVAGVVPIAVKRVLLLILRIRPQRRKRDEAGQQR